MNFDEHMLNIAHKHYAENELKYNDWKYNIGFREVILKEKGRSRKNN